MYKESDLLKSAKYHTNLCNSLQKSLVDNKIFAESAIIQKRLESKCKNKLLSTMKIKLNTAGRSDLSSKTTWYNQGIDFPSSVQTTINFHNQKNSCFEGRSAAEESFYQNRWLTAQSKELHNISRLSNISNFSKFFEPEVNTVK